MESDSHNAVVTAIEKYPIWKSLRLPHHQLDPAGPVDLEFQLVVEPKNTTSSSNIKDIVDLPMVDVKIQELGELDYNYYHNHYSSTITSDNYRIKQLNPIPVIEVAPNYRNINGTIRDNELTRIPDVSSRENNNTGHNNRSDIDEMLANWSTDNGSDLDFDQFDLSTDIGDDDLEVLLNE